MDSATKMEMESKGSQWIWGLCVDPENDTQPPACRYELHHGVRISDSALVDAAVMADRYIADRFLPDKVRGTLFKETFADHSCLGSKGIVCLSSFTHRLTF